MIDTYRVIQIYSKFNKVEIRSILFFAPLMHIFRNG